MKEIIAIVRMNKTGATKKALVDAGVAGFTAFKVMGRGQLIDDPAIVAERKAKMMALAGADEQDAEVLIDGFLDGHRLFPRRLFTILAHDEDVTTIIDAIMSANRTENGVGDGKIIVVPMLDAIRVRTGESGEEAV
ncbi:P-II family nitrogen regulator [Sporomusa sp.]|jgi:nitrogen regulatory protein PII 2|uniref:P-II family nitrogen regulator n=1 Tax=Sporomusa sp. TaxID=2078658 RepID=UPI0029786E00|nr:P-II family nitrogen regulator [Sporomusa sp.]MDF2572448.1 glnB 3 [Sporomusa sp.]MDF2875153.1 glnB 3 [Sporomusa sp.]HWR09274.1 P-II family nitrogen regulator [Sporomusa sp.]